METITIKARTYNEAVLILMEKHGVWRYKWIGVLDDMFTFENCNDYGNDW